MVMEWYNHWPLAKILARDTEVRWGEHRGVEKVVAELKTRKVQRLGFMGFLGLAKAIISLVCLSRPQISRSTSRLRWRWAWRKSGWAHSTEC